MTCYYCGNATCTCKGQVTAFACLNGHIVTAFDLATNTPQDLTNAPCPLCLGAFILHDTLPPACALAPMQ